MAFTVRNIGTNAFIFISKKAGLDARSLLEIDRHKFFNEMNIYAIFIFTYFFNKEKTEN